MTINQVGRVLVALAAVLMLSVDDYETEGPMHRFIILGNDSLPVNTRAEQLLAGRALNKMFPSGASVEIWTGIPNFSSDETGDILDSEGEVHRKRRYLSEDEF